MFYHVRALAVCGGQRHPQRPAGQAQQRHGWSQQSLLRQVENTLRHQWDVYLDWLTKHVFYCSLQFPASHRGEREADGRHLGTGEGNLKCGERQQRGPGCWQCPEPIMEFLDSKWGSLPFLVESERESSASLSAFYYFTLLRQAYGLFLWIKGMLDSRAIIV